MLSSCLMDAGHDAPFTNNYGVWLDEFQDMGLEHCLETSWTDAVCYFGEAKPIRVSRSCAFCWI